MIGSKSNVSTGLHNKKMSFLNEKNDNNYDSIRPSIRQSFKYEESN